MRRWGAAVEAMRVGGAPPFEEQLALFARLEETWPADAGPLPAWAPSPADRERSNPASLMAAVGCASHEQLHAWSVAERGDFWGRMVERLGIVLRHPPAVILDDGDGPESARWLPGARLSCVDSCFTAPPGRVAVVAGREGSAALQQVTYGELEERVDRLAAGLRRHGLGDGARVALTMPMTLESVVAYLGVVRAGAAVVSIADSFSAPEIARRLEIAAADAVVTVATFTRAGRTIPLFERVAEAGAPRAIVIGDGPLRPRDLRWEAVTAGDGAHTGAGVEPETVTNILFSSGTTGDPKAIPWTHLTPIKCAADGHCHQDVRPGDVVAWPTNIGWMMGPWLIYATLVGGATMALFEGAPGGADFARFVERAGVTILGVVPSLVRAWRREWAAFGADWRKVRLFSSTGEPSSREEMLWLMSLTGYRAPVIEYCGGTEIGGGYITGTVLRPAAPAAFSTPALGLDMVVADGAGRSVAAGETGEVFLVPPSLGLSQRLLNRDHHEEYFAGCPTAPGGVVLRRHGDLMVRLAGGYYRAAGRADDTMNLGGIKVASTEIEQLLAGHPAVRECAAVGVAPEGGGAERLVVFAVLSTPADPAELREELGRLLADRLNPLFRIAELRPVDQLPRTASGKVMRRRLRDR